MLKLKVTNQDIIIEEQTPLGDVLVSNSAGEYECLFEFDETWKDFIKTAVFTDEDDSVGAYGDKKIISEPRILEGDKCIVPKGVLRPNSRLKIGVYGVSGIKERPTVYTPLLYVRQGAVPSENMPEPDPSIYLQIIKIMEETKQIAQGVRDDLEWKE